MPRRPGPVPRRRPARRDPRLQQLAGLPEHRPVVDGVLPQGHLHRARRHRRPARPPQRRRHPAQPVPEALRPAPAGAAGPEGPHRTGESVAHGPGRRQGRQPEPQAAQDARHTAGHAAHRHRHRGPPSGHGHHPAHRDGRARLHRGDRRPRRDQGRRAGGEGPHPVHHHRGHRHHLHRRRERGHGRHRRQGRGQGPGAASGREDRRLQGHRHRRGPLAQGRRLPGDRHRARRRHPHRHRRHTAHLHPGRRVRGPDPGEGDLQGRRRGQGRGHRHPGHLRDRPHRERQGPLLQGRRRKGRTHPHRPEDRRQGPVDAAEAVRRRHHRHLPAAHHHPRRRHPHRPAEGRRGRHRHDEPVPVPEPVRLLLTDRALPDRHGALPASGGEGAAVRALLPAPGPDAPSAAFRAPSWPHLAEPPPPTVPGQRPSRALVCRVGSAPAGSCGHGCFG
ncbi:hypothetical protein SGPA1_31358 [Streptomyces misionensis JCM 4497]